MSLLAVGMVGLALAQSPRPGEAALKARAARSLPLVRSMAAEAAVVGAVVAQNGRHQSMAAIEKLDKAWISTRGVTELIRRYMDSPCARALREIAARDPAVVEAFAMDDQGALVCTIAKTTDYWQGDEPKWLKTYQDGREAFVEEPAFDVSTGTYAIQVSVPVVSEAGKRIGAVTLTLKLRRDTSRGR